MCVIILKWVPPQSLFCSHLFSLPLHPIVQHFTFFSQLSHGQHIHNIVSNSLKNPHICLISHYLRNSSPLFPWLLTLSLIQQSSFLHLIFCIIDHPLTKFTQYYHMIWHSSTDTHSLRLIQISPLTRIKSYYSVPLYPLEHSMCTVRFLCLWAPGLKFFHGYEKTGNVRLLISFENICTRPWPHGVHYRYLPHSQNIATMKHSLIPTPITESCVKALPLIYKASQPSFHILYNKTGLIPVANIILK